jgi:hypothetical protein
MPITDQVLAARRAQAGGERASARSLIVPQTSSSAGAARTGRAPSRAAARGAQRAAALAARLVVAGAASAFAISARRERRRVVDSARERGLRVEQPPREARRPSF